MENILSAYAEIPPFANEIGYKMKTTYWGDFTVAERLDGIKGVEDTFNRAFKYMKDDEVYLTELYLVANWKVWQHYLRNEKLAEEYQKINDEIDEYVDKNWNKKQKEYFYETTD